MNEARGRRTWRTGVACAGALALVAIATLSTGCGMRGPVVNPGGKYGATTDGTRKRERVHAGVDYSMPKGSAVIAPTDGEVLMVSRHRNEGGLYNFCGYGMHIFHEGKADGIMTKLCHLDSLDVTEGQRVKRGDKLGTVGITGCRFTCAPHLHFEVWVGSKHVKPSTRIAGCLGADGVETRREKPLTYPVRC